MSLLKNVKLTKIAGWNTTATSDISPLTRVDMAGFDGVLFIALGGKSDASDYFKLIPQHSSGSTDSLVSMSSTAYGGGFAGSTALAAGDDDMLFAVDVFRPTKRYVSCLMDRSTAGGYELDGCVAIQYNMRKGPVTQSTAAYGVVDSALFVSPTTA